MHMAAAAAAAGAAADGCARVWEGSREVAEPLIEVHECILVHLHVARGHEAQQLQACKVGTGRRRKVGGTAQQVAFISHSVGSEQR